MFDDDQTPTITATFEFDVTAEEEMMVSMAPPDHQS